MPGYRGAVGKLQINDNRALDVHFRAFLGLNLELFDGLFFLNMADGPDDVLNLG